MQNSYSVPQTVWKSGLVWLSWPFNTFLAILGQFWPKFDPNRPKWILQRQYSDFLCKICTQCLKLCGKLALFDTLSLQISIWPFGPILDLWGPKSPKQLGKHPLKKSPSILLTYWYWKMTLSLLVEFFWFLAWDRFCLNLLCQANFAILEIIPLVSRKLQEV